MWGIRMKIICDCCDNELIEQGGLLFNTPTSTNWCKKYHLCRNCFLLIEKYMLTYGDMNND